MAVPLGEGDPIEASYAFLQTYAARYGLDDARAQLWPRSADEVDGIHYRFVQRTTEDQGGLPLFNSGLTVHVLNGTIYLTTGRYIPHLVAQPPILSWEEALAQVVLEPALRGLEVQGEARLGLYAVWPEEDGAATVHTVWRMTVTGREAGHRRLRPVADRRRRPHRSPRPRLRPGRHLPQGLRHHVRLAHRRLRDLLGRLGRHRGLVRRGWRARRLLAHPGPQRRRPGGPSRARVVDSAPRASVAA